MNPAFDDSPLNVTLRELAERYEIDPSALLKDFAGGGALAVLVRKLLGAATPIPGRPADDAENWRRFVLVVLAKRRTKLGYSHLSVFARASDMDREADPLGDPEDRLQGKFKRTYSRMKRERGWTDEDVPASSIAALYSVPPVKS